MRQYKDIEDMTKDELEEYLDDISSGYAFDPDNEILDADKNLKVKDLFKQLNDDIESTRFKSMHEFAATVSRISRISEWMSFQTTKLSEKMNVEFEKKVMERRRNEGEEY